MESLLFTPKPQPLRQASLPQVDVTKMPKLHNDLVRFNWNGRLSALRTSTAWRRHKQHERHY